jgi:hypothetical protein
VEHDIEQHSFHNWTLPNEESKELMAVAIKGSYTYWNAGPRSGQCDASCKASARREANDLVQHFYPSLAMSPRFGTDHLRVFTTEDVMILAIRGTASWDDWRINLCLVHGRCQDTLQEDLAAATDAINELQPRQVAVTGHSQAGLRALYVSDHAGVRGYIFNGLTVGVT